MSRADERVLWFRGLLTIRSRELVSQPPQPFAEVGGERVSQLCRKEEEIMLPSFRKLLLRLVTTLPCPSTASLHSTFK